MFFTLGSRTFAHKTVLSHFSKRLKAVVSLKKQSAHWCLFSTLCSRGSDFTIGFFVENRKDWDKRVHL